jgi:LmbE family N-acetylglucosaminyl deacetylase
MTRAAKDVLARMAALPFAGLDDILAPGPALLLAPHPDDETLGCGGLIAESCARGRALHVLIVTDGTGSHAGSRAWPAERLRALREQEARQAVGELGLPADCIAFLGLRDTEAPHDGAALDEAVARIAAHATERGARTILTTWRHDPHGDHAAVSRMGAAVARAIGARLIEYPVWGWTLPRDQLLEDAAAHGCRLDITHHLPAKRRAIAAHRSQTADLIDDDPNGFRLPDEFLALFTRPFEAFLWSDD